MPKLITDPANEDYDFGKGFNYAVWPEGTIVTLTNVPWNNDYRDICQFPSASGQTLDEYIDSNSTTNTTVDSVSYLKFNVPVRINIPFNSAFRFNYLRVQNPLQPIPGTDRLKSYYYFILGMDYIAPNTTQINIQLDVFQSFKDDFNFGNSYIERGHIGIANENAFDNYGRDWLTSPEGIDYGGEYRTIHREKEVIMDVRNDDLALRPRIMVVSTVDFSADPGDVNNPVLVSARGAVTDDIPSGAAVYYFMNSTEFLNFMHAYSDKPWVTQGIISITMVPNGARYNGSNPYTAAITDPTGFNAWTAYTTSYIPNPIKHNVFPSWRDSADLLDVIPDRYKNLKKLFTFPYMVIEMTTWTGTPIILKPESWTDPDATIVERASFNPPNQRVEFYPQRYNALPGSIIDTTDSYDGAGPTDDGGDYLDLSTKIANFPTLMVVNNGALGYLASNFASIPYQRQSAGWTQSRALRGNEVSYDQNARGIQTSKGVMGIQNAGIGAQAASQNLLLAQQQATSGIGGVIAAAGGAGIGAATGGGASGLGGIAGAVANQVMGGILTGNAQDANTRGANINQQVNKGANAAQNQQAGYVNDTNKGLADWAARGDYENAIAGVNAQVNDASMIQPTSSGQQGGESINMAFRNVEVSLRWKLIDNAAVRTVGEYWLRYGYAVRKFAQIPTSFMVMSKFTYWKLLETYIVSSTMPEGFKQIIRGIFEKGVTVWADPSYIGTIDIADNEPLGGIVL